MTNSEKQTRLDYYRLIGGQKMSTKNRLSVCRGCYYYVGVADNAEIPHNVGRHLCGCVNGRYDSGANARYIDELAACPCAKWDDNNDREEV